MGSLDIAVWSKAGKQLSPFLRHISLSNSKIRNYTVTRNYNFSAHRNTTQIFVVNKKIAWANRYTNKTTEFNIHCLCVEINSAAQSNVGNTK
jgi:hypothetical protein